MSTFSVATLKRENMGDAAGLTSLVRNLGGSVGISLMTTLVTRSTQVHQDLMVGHSHGLPRRSGINSLPYRPPRCGNRVKLLMQAYGVLYQTLQQQAGLWAYVEHFRLLSLICIALVPIIFLFKKAKAAPEAEAMAH